MPTKVGPPGSMSEKLENKQTTRIRFTVFKTVFQMLMRMTSPHDDDNDDGSDDGDEEELEDDSWFMTVCDRNNASSFKRFDTSTMIFYTGRYRSALVFFPVSTLPETRFGTLLEICSWTLPERQWRASAEIRGIHGHQCSLKQTRDPYPQQSASSCCCCMAGPLRTVHSELHRPFHWRQCPMTLELVQSVESKKSIHQRQTQHMTNLNKGGLLPPIRADLLGSHEKHAALLQPQRIWNHWFGPFGCLHQSLQGGVQLALTSLVFCSLRIPLESAKLAKQPCFEESPSEVLRKVLHWLPLLRATQAACGLCLPVREPEPLLRLLLRKSHSKHVVFATQRFGPVPWRPPLAHASQLVQTGVLHLATRPLLTGKDRCQLQLQFQLFQTVLRGSVLALALKLLGHQNAPSNRSIQRGSKTALLCPLELVVLAIAIGFGVLTASSSAANQSSKDQNPRKNVQNCRVQWKIPIDRRTSWLNRNPQKYKAWSAVWRRTLRQHSMTKHHLPGCFQLWYLLFLGRIPTHLVPLECYALVVEVLLWGLDVLHPELSPNVPALSAISRFPLSALVTIFVPSQQWDQPWQPCAA